MERFTKQSLFRDTMNEALIAPMVPYYVTNIDYTKEKAYDLTFEEMPAHGYWNAESMRSGLNRLYEAAETGKWYFPLYTEEEIAEDPQKKEASLVWMPSAAPKAFEKPYVMVVPGGGYVNVWNLTEGWPIAAHLNKLGYNCFVLSYRVAGPLSIQTAIDDYAKALCYIRDNAAEFGVQWDRYLTTGFSAGASLILSWAMKNKGYAVKGLPKPLVMWPVYPPVSWKLMAEQAGRDDFTVRSLGMTIGEAAVSDWNVEEHVEDFPPCYIAATAEDSLVNPEHSRILKRALDAAGIPAVLNIGPTGDHGFAEGIGTCMEGWIEKAVAFAEENY